MMLSLRLRRSALALLSGVLAGCGPTTVAYPTSSYALASASASSDANSTASASPPQDPSPPRPSIVLAGGDSRDEPLLTRVQSWLAPPAVPPPVQLGNEIAWRLDNEATCVDCFVRFEHAAQASDGSFWVVGSAHNTPRLQGRAIAPAAGSAIEPLLLHVSADGRLLKSARYAARSPAASFDQVIVQGDGSLRVLGSFQTSVTVGKTTLTQRASPFRGEGELEDTQAAFIASFDSRGTPQWAVALAGSSNAHVPLLWDDQHGRSCVVGRRVLSGAENLAWDGAHRELSFGPPPANTPDALARNTVAQCFDASGRLVQEADLGALVALVASPAGDGSAALVAKRRVPGSHQIEYVHVRVDSQLRLGRAILLFTEEPSWESAKGPDNIERYRYMHPGHVSAGIIMPTGAEHHRGRYMSASAVDSYVILTQARSNSRSRIDVVHVDELRGAVRNALPLFDERSAATPGVRATATGIHRNAAGEPVLYMVMTYANQPLTRHLLGWSKPGAPFAVEFFADRSFDTWLPIHGSGLRLGANGKLSMLRAAAAQ